MNDIERLRESLNTGFIHYQINSSEEYQPSLLINDYKREKRVLTTLIRELNGCEAFFFSVAFITNSGVASIINILKELEARGVKGKIIASSYQNFTQPEALRRLQALSNVEVRIVTENNFHAKSYIFKQSQQYTLIIGSSNLTQNALSYNKEWNLKVTSNENGELLKYTLAEFERTFEGATEVTEEWLKTYEAIYKLQFKKQRQVVIDVQDKKAILPNKMQLEALKALEALRAEGKDKALLISATGTGKTYFSAFDAQRVKPKHLLFVVHRENITRASLKSYKRIFGPTVSMGILSGNTKDYEAEYLFSTVQTLSKDYVLSQFEPEYFDYIVIDEVHRAGSSSYEKILSYFKPKFLLGMTATPERMDGYDIYKAFDYNIAYEIRLNRALEEQMLCPFHYYGVNELTVDGALLDEKASFNHLVCDERVNHIIEKAQLYGCDHGRIKGLVFCSKVNEAKELSLKFNERGFKTVALDGSSSEEERERAIENLEQDEKQGDYLDYIFTVDIFNEGVDIPTVNQIIMLRPTQSAIVFVQQLGRGLRRAENKEYVVVIDFIGNYANNYLVPIALYGDHSYNKDNLRKLMNMGSCTIPGVSTVNFDVVTKERIYEAINATNMITKKALLEEYKKLKYKLGRMPMMMDFVTYEARDPMAFIDYADSYYHFAMQVETAFLGKLDNREMKHLAFYSKELGSAKRIEELLILKLLIAPNAKDILNGLMLEDVMDTKNKVDKEIVEGVVKEILLHKEKNSLEIKIVNDLLMTNYGYELTEENLSSAISFLNATFFKKQDQDKYQSPESVYLEQDKLYLAESLKQDLQNPIFEQFLVDLLDYSIHKYNKCYKRANYNKGLIRYQKYSRKDVCHLLNWEKDESSTMYGYRIKYNTCPIFVTYHKEEGISESTKYEDAFINAFQFSWMTRNGVRIDSKEVVAIRDASKSNLRIAFFIKKSDGEGSDFYYMGDVAPLSLMETTIKTDKGEEKPIVNINFQLDQEVEEHLYDYLRGIK